MPIDRNSKKVYYESMEKQRVNKRRINFALTGYGSQALESLAEQRGQSLTAVVESLVREAFERAAVELEQPIKQVAKRRLTGKEI